MEAKLQSEQSSQSEVPEDMWQVERECLKILEESMDAKLRELKKWHDRKIFRLILSFHGSEARQNLSDRMEWALKHIVAVFDERDYERPEDLGAVYTRNTMEFVRLLEKDILDHEGLGPKAEDDDLPFCVIREALDPTWQPPFAEH